VLCIQNLTVDQLGMNPRNVPRLVVTLHPLSNLSRAGIVLCYQGGAASCAGSSSRSFRTVVAGATIWQISGARRARLRLL
jgi:hypothetical protein